MYKRQAEDNPALVLSELTLDESQDQWRQRKGAMWTKTFSKLPIPELKKVQCCVIFKFIAQMSRVRRDDRMQELLECHGFSIILTAMNSSGRG